MAPYIRSLRSKTTSNATVSPLPAFTISSQSSSSSSGMGNVISTVVFGTLAFTIGLITIWQAHRAWQLWRTHHTSSGGASTSPAANATVDLEGPIQTVPSSLTLDGPLPAHSTPANGLTNLPTPCGAHGNTSTAWHSMADHRQDSPSPRSVISPNTGDDPLEGAAGATYSRDPQD
ncbi:MAG: hypothetical protein M1830_000983 [Pleopsidium flavum]|nr:MAG: hypothetical protein M1830_000983 [Pleopsidium flavum]